MTRQAYSLHVDMPQNTPEEDAVLMADNVEALKLFANQFRDVSADVAWGRRVAWGVIAIVALVVSGIMIFN